MDDILILMAKVHIYDFGGMDRHHRPFRSIEPEEVSYSWIYMRRSSEFSFWQPVILMFLGEFHGIIEL